VRVLIVEDEPLVRERLARMSRELLGPGALVTAQGSVDDASDALRALPIDLLLLDLS
jgi:CheY-like chemotaxis protein